jgi:iron(III) transport system ATP-binding protein
VIRPRCLLLDEPLSNLDARLRVEMRAEIRRVCKESGLTTVYVTHDQKEALSIADRMAILDHGRLLQLGAPREIYRRPHSRMVADFIGETDFIAGTLVSFEDNNVVVDTAAGRFLGVLGDVEAQPTVGAAVTVSVRPECWVLSSRDPGLNAVRGRIGEAVFLGEVAQYALLAGGTELKVLEINPRFLDHARRGEVFASAAPEDVVVLLA